MPIDSRFGCLWKCLGVVFHNKKDVETVPVTRSTTEAVGIAHLVRTSNSRPHADMTTQYTLLYNKISLMIFHKRQMTIRVCELSYPWASIIAMLLDKMLKSFLRFQWSENKARDKRLFHICNLPLRLCRLFNQTLVPSLWISLFPMSWKTSLAWEILQSYR